MSAEGSLKALMWLVCAFHVGIGLGLNVIPGMAPFMAKVYGAQLTWTPEFTYILKPLGAFMLALGLIAVAAAREPLRNPMIIYGFVTLFVIRTVQRWVFAQELVDHFSIGAGRNLVHSIFFLSLAVALVVLLHKARRQATEPIVTS